MKDLELPDFKPEKEEDELAAMMQWIKSRCYLEEIFEEFNERFIESLDSVPNDIVTMTMSVVTLESEAGYPKSARKQCYAINIKDAHDHVLVRWFLLVEKQDKAQIIGFGRHQLNDDPDMSAPVYH